MNSCTIIGNITRDPQSRTVNGRDGQISVCDFTVAVNRRQRGADGKEQADFFRVTAWRGLGETCQKYLAKGRKVCVVGPVSCRTYQGNDGVTRASLEITAEDVEFLSSRQEGTPAGYTPPAAPAGYTPPVEEQQSLDVGSGYAVVEEDDLPF